MKILADWIRAGISGAVVGPAGIGKSTLLGFLCHRPDVLRNYLPTNSTTTIPVSIDLNNLPADDTSTLYRVILRSIYESRYEFDVELQQLITSLYMENRNASDPFLPQSALRELFLKFQGQQMLIVLVLDRFDSFCQVVEPKMVDTLRGLRNSFKDTICFIVGIRQEVSYLSDPTILGELYELLDNYVCWVQPIKSIDAGQLIAFETRNTEEELTEVDLQRILTLGGGHPALLEAICHWWNRTPDRSENDWVDSLVTTTPVQYRLNKIWRSLTLAEQQVLGDIQKWQLTGGANTQTLKSYRNDLNLDVQQQLAASMLAQKGLITPVEEGWKIRASLLSIYAAQVAGLSPGTIWIDENSDILYQGSAVLKDLTPLESGLLHFLVCHPQVRHTHTNIIDAVWPEDVNSEGVSTEALYQLVRGLRRKIEPNPSQPRYLISWRGSPEGGYQCFPDGLPG
jgi:hypothetical protein